MCIYATVINVVNFSDGLQTRKFSPPYFLVAATVLNGLFLQVLFLTDIKRKMVLITKLSDTEKFLSLLTWIPTSYVYSKVSKYSIIKEYISLKYTQSH